MASERYWPDIVLTPIGVSGVKNTTVSSTIGLKVKMLVTINHPSQQPLILEIKNVVDATNIVLGVPDKGFSNFVQPVAYVGGTLTVQHAEKYKIAPDLIFGAVYDREPTVALRNVLVDPLGNYYDKTNPLQVQLSDGSINIGTVNAELEVFLTHLDNFPNSGEIHDSIRIGDGVETLAINPDGSINVNAIVSLPSGISTEAKQDVGNASLASIDAKLTQLQQNGSLAIGTEDGTTSGIQHVFVNSLKSMILAAKDRQRDVVYLDLASRKNRRVDKFEYTSSTFPGVTLVRQFNYSLVGTEYVFTNDNWALI